MNGSMTVKIVVVGLLAAYLVPTAHSVGLSFNLLPIPKSTEGPTLDSYVAVLSNPRLLSALARSVATALGVSIVAVAICLVGLEGYRSLPSSQQRWVLALILAPLFVPETTHAMTLNLFLSQLGIPKGMLTVGIAHVVYVIPFVAMIILLEVATIPESLWWSVEDLGLSAWRRLRLVSLPLLWPSLLMSGVFAFLLSFNEYARAHYLSGSEFYSVYLRGQLAGGGNQAIYAVSAALLLIGAALLLLAWKTRLAMLRPTMPISGAGGGVWGSAGGALRRVRRLFLALPWRTVAKEAAGILGVVVALWSVLFIPSEYLQSRLESQRRLVQESYFELIRNLGNPGVVVRVGAISQIPNVIAMRAPADREVGLFGGIRYVLGIEDYAYQAPYHQDLLRIISAMLSAPKGYERQQLESDAIIKMLCALGPEGWYHARPRLDEARAVDCLSWVWRNAPAAASGGRLVPAYPLFRRADLRDADLHRLDLARAEFSYSTLTNVSFESSTVEQARFSGARLAGVSFANSSLKGSDFTDAVLCNIDFSGADLAEADFSNARVAGQVHVAHARNLGQAIGAEALTPGPVIAACGDLR